MNDEPVLAGVSGTLLEYLRGALCPGVLSEGEGVKLTHPGAEEEFRLGLSLYDIEEIHPGGPPRPVPLGEDRRRFPGLTLSLHYLAFANRKAAFHGVEAGDELLLLEGVLRAVADAPDLTWDGQRLHVFLQPLEFNQRASLWQSLSCPLQPAVYLTVEPASIPSARILKVPAVRSAEVRSGQMREEDGA